MLSIIHMLVSWRRFIFWAGFLSAAAMAVVSFLLPKWYTASSSVFPPDPNQFGAVSARLQFMQSLQMPMLGPNASGSAPSTIYVDVLNSRRVGQTIIEEFNLKEVYGIKIMADALEKLQSHSFQSLFDNGLLTISFEDKDPERAAAVTNRYVELLDEFTQELNVTRASTTKEFIATQIEIHARDLRDAEEALRKFEEENKTLQLDSRVERAIGVVSALTADAIALEVDLQLLRQYASQSSQEYIRKKRRYDEITRQLRKFEFASAREEGDVVRAFFPTFDTVPEKKLEMARRMRRVLIEEKVYGFLIEEFEKSRLEEARDTPTVQVLDVATVPELKSRPKRGVLVLAGGVVGVAWASVMVVFVSVWREDSRHSNTLRSVIEPVLADLVRPFRRRRRQQ